MEDTNQYRPFIAVANAHGICTAQHPANNKPAMFAWPACPILPRIKWEKLVVIPQLGQGTPQTIRTVHGGKPIC